MKPIDRQVILVTGATDGIGRGAAEELARRGATVLLHGRDPARLAAARAEIAAATGSDRLETYVADFASLAEIRALAAAVAAAHDRLDVLLNNAGIGGGRKGEQRREVSRDGHELRFQVNYLSAFLLARLLLPLLERARPARIVNVASGAQMAIDFDDVMLERDYGGFRAYSQSKLAMVMDAFTLGRRLDPRTVTATALHPGTLLDTKLVREGFGTVRGPVETGIRSEVHLATAPELEGVTGAYFDETRPARAAEQAYDLDAREALLRLSGKLTGL